MIETAALVMLMLGSAFSIGGFLIRNTIATRDKKLEQLDIKANRIGKELQDLRVKIAEEYVHVDHLDKHLGEIKELIRELKEDIRNERNSK